MTGRGRTLRCGLVGQVALCSLLMVRSMACLSDQSDRTHPGCQPVSSRPMADLSDFSYAEAITALDRGALRRLLTLLQDDGADQRDRSCAI